MAPRRIERATETSQEGHRDPRAVAGLKVLDNQDEAVMRATQAIT